LALKNALVDEKNANVQEKVHENVQENDGINAGVNE